MPSEQPIDLQLVHRLRQVALGARQRHAFGDIALDAPQRLQPAEENLDRDDHELDRRRRQAAPFAVREVVA